MKRQLLAALIGSLAMVVAPMLGCGGDPPPSSSQNQNQNQNNNDPNDNNGDDDECTIDADCEDEEGPHVCNQDSECEAVECTEDYHCEDAELCDDQNNSCEALEYDCEADDEFFGQIGGEEENQGGEPTTDPLTESAGLDEVQTALDDAWDAEGDQDDSGDDEPHIIDIDVGDGIEIEGATVTAVGYPAEGNVFVEDADAAVKIFRLGDEIEDDGDILEDVAVGQKVNFTIEAAEIYNADPSIREISDWEVVEEDSDVPFIELDGAELDKETHFNRNVRMTGQILPNSWDCGATCHEMRYGTDGEHMSVFRSPSEEDTGDCFTFLGPIGTFPGVYDEGAEAQIDADNFDWFWINFD